MRARQFRSARKQSAGLAAVEDWPIVCLEPCLACWWPCVCWSHARARAPPIRNRSPQRWRKLKRQMRESRGMRNRHQMRRRPSPRSRLHETWPAPAGVEQGGTGWPHACTGTHRLSRVVFLQRSVVAATVGEPGAPRAAPAFDWILRPPLANDRVHIRTMLQTSSNSLPSRRAPGQPP